jgi:hypothetical protein
MGDKIKFEIFLKIEFDLKNDCPTDIEQFLSNSIHQVCID